MRRIKIKSVHSVNDLGVTITSNLKFSQQCKESLIKANRMMGLIKRIFSFKNKDAVIILSDVILSIFSLQHKKQLKGIKKKNNKKSAIRCSLKIKRSSQNERSISRSRDFGSSSLVRVHFIGWRKYRQSKIVPEFTSKRDESDEAS